MTQPVKLHVLPPSHTHAAPVTRMHSDEGLIDGPSLRYALDTDGYALDNTAGMVLHQGTLYTESRVWTAVDHDRAAALGYGPSEPWPEFPAPDFIKPGPVTQYLNPKVDSLIRMDPAQQLQALEEARQKKVLMLNAHIYPQSGAFILGRGVRIVSKTPDQDASFILTWDTFDRLTVLQLQEHIKNRLK